MQCTCISIFSKIRLVDQSKPCTQIYLQIIINCINLQLATRISRNHSFQTRITQFSRSKPILRSNDSEPRSKVISTDDGHVRIVSRNLQSDVIYNTRCTRGVRVVFSVTRMRSSNSARINKFDFRTEKSCSVHMTVFEIVAGHNVVNWMQLLT